MAYIWLAEEEMLVFSGFETFGADSVLWNALHRNKGLKYDLPEETLRPDSKDS